MPLLITAHFPHGRYDAADVVDTRRPEYPPSVARLLCALRDVADPDEVDALDELEALPAPEIWAPPAPLSTDRRNGYVVVNDVHAKGGSQFHTGRSNALKTRSGVVLADPVIRFWWPTADVAHTDTLDRLLSRIHYLGRSTSVVRLEASAQSPVERPERCFRPAVTGGIRVRLPYPGYRRDLEAVYAAGGSAWTVPAREQRYVYGTTADTTTVVAPTVVPSVFDDTVVWRLTARPGMLSARDVLGLTNLLRRAVHHCVWHSLGHGDVEPDVAITDERAQNAGIRPEITGRVPGGRHVAYTVLPDCGYRRADGTPADGRPMGVAMLLPHLDDPAERKLLRQQLFRAIADEPGLVRLSPWRDGKSLELQRVDPADSGVPRALQLSRWSKPSRFWATATPYVLDRYVKRGGLREAFALSCELAGLPTPRSVAVQNIPFVDGAVVLRHRDITWGKRSRRPMYQVAAEFDQQLTGPILVGALRFLGLGLMTPLTETRFRTLQKHDAHVEVTW